MKVFKQILGGVLITQILPLLAGMLYFILNKSFVGFYPIYCTIFTYGNCGVLIVFLFAWSIIKLFEE